MRRMVRVVAFGVMLMVVFPRRHVLESVDDDLASLSVPARAEPTRFDDRRSFTSSSLSGARIVSSIRVVVPVSRSGAFPVLSTDGPENAVQFFDFLRPGSTLTRFEFPLLDLLPPPLLFFPFRVSCRRCFGWLCGLSLLLSSSASRTFLLVLLAPDLAHPLVFPHELELQVLEIDDLFPFDLFASLLPDLLDERVGSSDCRDPDPPPGVFLLGRRARGRCGAVVCLVLLRSRLSLLALFAFLGVGAQLVRLFLALPLCEVLRLNDAQVALEFEEAVDEPQLEGLLEPRLEGSKRLGRDRPREVQDRDREVRTRIEVSVDRVGSQRDGGRREGKRDSGDGRRCRYGWRY